jgi:ParB/RepB/Spo0J family partition protein
MSNKVEVLALDKILDHPGNPNSMSSENFRKLVANIESSGKYEPIVVRRHPEEQGFYQIINGHHRRKALAKLGIKCADTIVWDVNDEQVNIFLATLNRLSGKDDLSMKLKLLKKIAENKTAKELSRILPHSTKQIEKMLDLKRIKNLDASEPLGDFSRPLIFFLTEKQRHVIDNAIVRTSFGKQKNMNADDKALALIEIARVFLESKRDERRIEEKQSNA